MDPTNRGTKKRFYHEILEEMGLVLISDKISPDNISVEVVLKGLSDSSGSSGQ